jgi:hypothetical protein
MPRFEEVTRHTSEIVVEWLRENAYSAKEWGAYASEEVYRIGQNLSTPQVADAAVHALRPGGAVSIVFAVWVSLFVLRVALVRTVATRAIANHAKLQ